MTERGVSVDHSTINRWVNKFSSLLEAEARKRRNPVGTSWRLDETYIRVTGKWKYFFRAVDKDGKTIDFLLTAKRDERAARRFFSESHRKLRRAGLDYRRQKRCKSRSYHELQH